MKAERPHDCREWRMLLGAYALGDLTPDERAALEAHLEGCPECQAEAESLGTVAQLLPLADPARFSRPAPQPPPELGQRVADAIGGEQRASRRRRRWRFGLALGGAAAAAAAIVAIAILPSGGDGGPVEHVEFGALPGGVKIYATLEPHAYGTEVHVYVKGVRSGTLCQVDLRGPGGERFSAGTFRYRWSDDSTAVLSSALDLSRTRAISVRAGNRTFVAPVNPPGPAAIDPTEKEDVT
jgi:hypothetical protein